MNIIGPIFIGDFMYSTLTYIYRITNKSDNKTYIGNSIQLRENDPIPEGYHRGRSIKHKNKVQ